MSKKAAVSMMMSTFRPALVAVLAVALGLVSAVSPETLRADSDRPFWMSADALHQTFSGQAITGNYSDGRTFDESYAAAGRLVYTEHEPPRRQTGHWSIVNDRFCTIYDTSSSGGCFRVHQVSANCFEFYFETRTEEEARRSTPRNPTWTARAWRVDAVPTCDGKPTV
jgi:hypothetical protein